MKLFTRDIDYIFLVVMLLSILGLLSLLAVSPSRANAMSGSNFNPGGIIDDEIFYNPDTMTVEEIQNFLEDMLNDDDQIPDGIAGTCDTNGNRQSEFGGGTRAQYAASNPNDSVHGPPYICLSQYYENPTTKANNLHGKPIPDGAKSSAQIIYDVAQSQRINPKILLVLLQKEQALVTDDWPTEIQYRSATGYGCPDSSVCDSQYYGFYNQVFRAAYQFNLYKNYPSSYSHRAGVTNNVRYSPNSSCGTKAIFIENVATAGLYNYTPYTPNTAALDNLYGLGDSCSSYGNRNFWRLFKDWFNSVYGDGLSITYPQSMIFTPNTNGSLLFSAIDDTRTVIDRTEDAAGSATWGAPITTPTCAEGISTSTLPDGRIISTVIGCNKSVWINTQTSPNSSEWTGWTNILGSVRDITTAVEADGRITIAVVGGNKSVWINTQTAPNSDTWAGWVDLSGSVRDMSTAVEADGRITIAVIGSNKSVWINTQTSPNSSEWTGWTNILGSVRDITTAVEADGRITIAVVGRNRRLWINTQTASNSSEWTGWAQLSGNRIY